MNEFFKFVYLDLSLYFVIEDFDLFVVVWILKFLYCIKNCLYKFIVGKWSKIIY